MSDTLRASAEPKHPIRIAARRAGLSPEVLRAWEARFGVVSPERGPSGRRLYSDADVARLSLLREATEAGRGIGSVAGLAPAELAALVASDRLASAGHSPAPAPLVGDPHGLLSAGIDAARRLDARALERVLGAGTALLPPDDFIALLLLPLMRTIGDEWEHGDLTVAHEHLASAVVRDALGVLARARSAAEGAPRVVVAAPAGQRHELGALAVAVTVAGHGYQPVYLGADLPAADIARAAGDRHARAVLLSITSSMGEAALRRELTALRAALPPEVRIIVGGLAAEARRGAILSAGAECEPDLDDLSSALPWREGAMGTSA